MEELRLAMVARDAWAVLRLAESLTRMPDDAVGIVAPAFFIPFAFYVVEAHTVISDLLGQPIPIAAMRDNGVVARALRAQMKLNEENAGRPGLLPLLRESDAKSMNWFNRPHAGLLGPLKRWLQPDLGISFVNQHVVSTTHLALAAMSLGALEELDAHEDPFSVLGLHSRGFAREVIEFVAPVARRFPQHEQGAQPTPRFATDRRDYKSATFFADISRSAGVALGNAHALVATLATVNVAHVVLPRMLPADSDFLLRQRFLTAHYAMQRLSHLNADSGVGSATFIRRLSTVIAAGGGRDLRRIGSRLRGDIAHYGVDAFRLAPEGPGPGSLREALTNCAEVEALAAGVLGVISEECRPLITLR